MLICICYVKSWAAWTHGHSEGCWNIEACLFPRTAVPTESIRPASDRGDLSGRVYHAYAGVYFVGKKDVTVRIDGYPRGPIDLSLCGETAVSGKSANPCAGNGGYVSEGIHSAKTAVVLIGDVQASLSIRTRAFRER